VCLLDSMYIIVRNQQQSIVGWSVARAEQRRCVFHLIELQTDSRGSAVFVSFSTERVRMS
jgi:hypothetical protein